MLGSLKRFKTSWDSQTEVKKATCLADLKTEIKGWMAASGIDENVSNVMSVIDTDEANYHLAIRDKAPVFLETRAMNWDMMDQCYLGHDQGAPQIYIREHDPEEDDLASEFGFQAFMA